MRKVLTVGVVMFMFGIVVCLLQCAKVPVKQFYILNYEPEPLKNRMFDGPYPFTIRIKEFDIEQAYDRPQLVYRKSPYELEYYFFRVWAVKPVRMFTDLIYKHLAATNIVSHVVRRVDEGTTPEYELSGYIESLEEYDNEDVWFAHIAVRIKLTRIKDNRTLYSRRFDRRKQVFQQEAGYVIRELSQIIDYIISQAMHDLDIVLAKEYGMIPQSATDSAVFNDLESDK